MEIVSPLVDTAVFYLAFYLMYQLRLLFWAAAFLHSTVFGRWPSGASVFCRGGLLVEIRLSWSGLDPWGLRGRRIRMLYFHRSLGHVFSAFECIYSCEIWLGLRCLSSPLLFRRIRRRRGPVWRYTGRLPLLRSREWFDWVCVGLSILLWWYSFC